MSELFSCSTTDISLSQTIVMLTWRSRKYTTDALQWSTSGVNDRNQRKHTHNRLVCVPAASLLWPCSLSGPVDPFIHRLLWVLQLQVHHFGSNKLNPLKSVEESEDSSSLSILWWLKGFCLRSQKCVCIQLILARIVRYALGLRYELGWDVKGIKNNWENAGETGSNQWFGTGWKKNPWFIRQPFFQAICSEM